MSRNNTRSFAVQRRSLSAAQKIFLAALTAALTVLTLWAGLQPAHSAAAEPGQKPAVQIPNPNGGVVAPACFPRPKMMVAWYPLDEPNGSTTVQDIAGFNNQGISKPGALGTTNANAGPGRVGGTVTFNSTAQTNGPHIEVPDHSEINFGTGDLSIDAWVFVPQPSAVYIHPIVDKLSYNTSGTQGIGYAFSLVSSFSSGARLQFVMGGGGPLASYLGPNAPSVPFNTWTHVAVVVNRGAGTIAFVVNGVQVAATGPALPSYSITNNLPLLIGESRSPGAVQAAIKIDELELFNRPLAAAEFLGMVNAGPTGKCKCLATSNETISCWKMGSFKYTFTLTNYSGTTISVVNFSSSSALTVSPASLTIPPLASGASTTVTLYISGSSAVPGSSVCFSLGLAGPAGGCKIQHCIKLPICPTSCATPPANMVSWWPLDETAGNTVVDIIGSHNGTTSASIGADPMTTAPKVGNALFFVNSKATVASAPYNFGAGNFSIDAWVKGPVSNAALGIVDKLDTSTTIPTGYSFFIRSGSVRLVMGNGLSTPATFMSPATFNYNTWQHVAVTVQRVGLGAPIGRFYLNGVQVSTFVPPLTNVNNNANLLLGSHRLNVGCSSCEVGLDEIEIFKDVVPASNILAIFQADAKGKCKPQLPQLPDLSIVKKVHCKPLPGACAVTFSITNNGPGAFNGILVLKDVVTPVGSTPSPGLTWAGSSTPPGWSCGIGPSNTIGCGSTSAVSLGAGQTTTFSISVNAPGGHFNNCVSVNGYTQYLYNATTLIPEGNTGNNQHCVPMP